MVNLNEVTMRISPWIGMVGVVLAGPLAAQPNPFKLPKMNIKAHVTYQLAGDQKGTSETAIDGDRFMTKTQSSIKMMGKETKANHWSLVTADSMYNADLDKKEGWVSPNLLPYYAKAYDQLDGAGKQRFHSNIKEMGAMMSKAFDINSFGSLGDNLGEETIAGEVCENRQFASFTICTMKKGPRLSLKTTGDLLCFRFEQTATAVSLGAPPSSAWEPPAGVTFKPMAMENADSGARGFVGYFASQQLADSLAASKARLEQAKADASAKGQPTEMTPEQKEQAKQACEMLKNFDLGKAMSNALNQMKKELGNAAVDAAKQGATNKLKGLFKKPRIP